MTTNDEAPDPADPPNAFTGKTLAEIDAFELGGRLTVPAAFTRKGAGGEMISVPIRLAEARMVDRGKAKIEAIAYVGTLVKHAVRTVPDAEAAVGADVFDQLDTAAIVSQCCLDPKPPHGRHQTLLGMLETYGVREVMAMYRRLDALTAICSGDEFEPTGDNFWPMVETIARVKHLGPLAAMPGDGQRSFITRMAEEALSSRQRSS